MERSEHPCPDMGIIGVCFQPLKVIDTPGGPVLHMLRPDSPTRNVLLELLLGRPDHYGLLRIPTGVWYGFTAAGDGPALICNCADLPHDPEEGEHLPADTKDIPYSWD